MLVIGEFCLGLNLVGSISKSLENLEDVGSLLHGDNSKLILFVNPHKESLGIVMEDTTGFGPVALETATFEILVTTLEEEVIGNKLGLLGFGHGAKRVILTLEFASESGESGGDLLLNFTSLDSSHSCAQWVVGEVTSNANSCRVDHLVFISGEVGALQLGVVHVGDVLG